MPDERYPDFGSWELEASTLNAIESAYNSTPFFEYYKDDFRPFYEKNMNF